MLVNLSGRGDKDVQTVEKALATQADVVSRGSRERVSRRRSRDRAGRAPGS